MHRGGHRDDGVIVPKAYFKIGLKSEAGNKVSEIELHAPDELVGTARDAYAGPKSVIAHLLGGGGDGQREQHEADESAA
jgi:hypothetical protein